MAETSIRKKEKLDREMRIMVPQSLFDIFQEICLSEYKTLSEKIRNLMLEHIRKYQGKQ